MFVRTKQLAHRLRIFLGLLGVNAEELHGNLTQLQVLDVHILIHGINNETPTANVLLLVKLGKAIQIWHYSQPFHLMLANELAVPFHIEVKWWFLHQFLYDYFSCRDLIL